MSRKKINQNNSDIYGELVDFQDRLHAQNLKRIHIGLLCVLIIPMIFLSLMFITDSNKVIWLILWIVSLFAISSYLIVVEYGDYNLQHRINSITGSDGIDAVLQIIITASIPSQAVTPSRFRFLNPE